jgi:hypothetical protein
VHECRASAVGRNDDGDKRRVVRGNGKWTRIVTLRSSRLQVGRDAIDTVPARRPNNGCEERGGGGMSEKHVWTSAARAPSAVSRWSGSPGKHALKSSRERWMGLDGDLRLKSDRGWAIEERVWAAWPAQAWTATCDSRNL